MPLNVVLTRPSIRFRDSFLKAAREFQSAGSALQDMIGLDLEVVERNFERYLETRHKFENPALLAPGYVPQSEFWLVEGTVFIGRSKLRHTLNAALREFGGHIGYEVRPSKRGLGFGTQLLRLTLLEARRLGIERALLTCDADNAASRHVIESNGGELEGEFTVSGHEKLIRRYWIAPPLSETLSSPG